MTIEELDSFFREHASIPEDVSEGTASSARSLAANLHFEKMLGYRKKFDEIKDAMEKDIIHSDEDKQGLTSQLQNLLSDVKEYFEALRNMKSK